MDGGLRFRMMSRALASARAPSVALALRASLFAAAGLLASACHAESAADRHLAELREAVTKVQNDRDRLDQRVGALEIALADERRRAAETSAAGKAEDRPRPPSRAVQLGEPSDVRDERQDERRDGGAREAREEGEDAGRPEIRLVGAPAVRTRGRADRRGRESTLEVSEARSSALDPDAKRAYEAALALVQQRSFDKGLDELTAFLVRWPDHPYAENAMYWRGEAYYAKADYRRAAEEFEGVIARFGGGSKGPDALLKLGMCHDRLGAPARAAEYWERLKNEHPKSEAARRIPSGRDVPPNGSKESR